MRIIGVLVCAGVVIIGGQWMYDRSGAISTMADVGSGGLVQSYKTLNEAQPWIIDSDIVREYMESDLDRNIGHIVHSQQSLSSDLLWIRNIQQVGKFVMRRDVPHFFSMMDQLTALSPTWAYPYVFVQQIGPIHPDEHGTITDTQKSSRQSSVERGERGIAMTCDTAKIQAIKNLSDQEFVHIINERGADYDRLAEPCSTYELPHTLAFNYFYHIKNLEQAINYYKIASFHQDSPQITSSMPAILRSRQGEHLISAQLWFDRASSLSNSTDETLVASYTRALHKAIQSLQLHILTTANESDTPCQHDYQCMLSSGSLASTLRILATQCTADADLSEQIQCILLSQATEGGYILPTGAMYDPTSEKPLGSWTYDDKWGWRFER